MAKTHNPWKRRINRAAVWSFLITFAAVRFMTEDTKTALIAAAGALMVGGGAVALIARWRIR